MKLFKTSGYFIKQAAAFVCVFALLFSVSSSPYAQTLETESPPAASSEPFAEPAAEAEPAPPAPA
ncbi:MAG: hypothetical protein ACK5L3_01920, partial [Oscillospiraceae bacterium]